MGGGWSLEFGCIDFVDSEGISDVGIRECH